MAQTPRWYGAAGALIGVICGAVLWLGSMIWPPVIAAALAVLAGLMITGALHEDGLADTVDGLGGGRTAERALEIMRDSRIGSYGALALIASSGLRVMALAALPGAAAPVALIAGHAASRAAMVSVMKDARYLRADGAGLAVAGRVLSRTLSHAALTAVLASVPLIFVVPLWSVLAGLAGLIAGHFAMRRWFLRRLGGYTGDCLGAVQQASEIGFYIGLAAWL